MNVRRPKLAGERGAAVVIAIIAITITAAVAAALVLAATTFLHSSSRDAANKRALAAAEAGLSVGTYRYGRITASPSTTFAEKCITDREEEWKKPSPHCPVATGYLNLTGASSSYYLTPDMSSSLEGMPAVRTECNYKNPGERCLTAIGTVNGVTRRVQERVKPLELFTVHGMVGLQKIHINSNESWSGSNFQITSDTASNEEITFGQNVNAPNSPYHCEIGPKGTEPPCGSQNVRRSTPITVPAVETFPFGPTMEKNKNSTISTGYEPTSRSLKVGVGATLTLAEGDYNFCSVELLEGATLSAGPGARVKIYIDSPSRSGSNCKTGGTFEAENKGAKLNPGSGQGQLELYLYGTSPAVESPPPPNNSECHHDLNFNNKASGPSSNLYIYAPDSTVTLKSNAFQQGAVVGCELIYWAESSSARWDFPPVGTPPSNGVAAVSGSFRECTPQYSGDPESSCG